MTEQRTDEFLGWMGQHAYDAKAGQASTGMRAGISLTAVRGSDAADWLLRLGAAREAVEAAVPYRDYRLPDPPEPVSPAQPYSVSMFGTCGEWTYVLEDDLAATWFLAQFDNPGVLPRPEEEMVCVSLNLHDAPGMIAYSPPGTGDVWTAEFGRGLLEDAFGTVDDPSGELSAFDEALARAGAMYSRLDSPRPWPEIRAEEWAAAVYRAVGRHFGISVSRAEVEQGLLPAVALPLPQ
ncbi:hypothetical protein ACIP4Y_03595 [Streptomyces sp. NPDC088810]|uniref:hypothetical protein n=1 Tax=Streptomyces sp. NPDC088810 TaxID=3365904 RepID=UPI00382D95ED